MVMNGFDTNFDLANEVYAVNTVGFHYVDEPIRVARAELVRIYLVNVLEYDPVNSFHIHGNFFHYFPTGTSLQPSEFTDTVIQGQAQRGILELRVPLRRRLHVPRPRQRVRRARLVGLLPRRRPSQADRRRRRRDLLRPALGQGGTGLMEAGARAERPLGGGLPAWALGLIPLVLIAAAIGAFALLGGPGLGERTGRRSKRSRSRARSYARATIELTLRNDGPDPVEVAQVAVNDAYAPFVAEGGREIGRLGSMTLTDRLPLDRRRGATRSSSSPRPAARSKRRSRSRPKRLRTTSASSA